MRVLAVGAHPDDVELGCGGTIASLVEEGHEVFILVLTNGREGGDARDQAERSAESLGVKGLYLQEFQDQRLDCIPRVDVVRAVEDVARVFPPQIVLTHDDSDRNLDHRIVHEAVMTAFRPLPGSTLQEVYAFEVPSSTEWGTGFKPTVFQKLDWTHVQRKLLALSFYEEEMREWPHPRSALGVVRLAELRGAQSGVRYAEASRLMFAKGSTR